MTYFKKAKRQISRLPQRLEVKILVLPVRTISFPQQLPVQLIVLWILGMPTAQRTVVTSPPPAPPPFWQGSRGQSPGWSSGCRRGSWAQAAPPASPSATPAAQDWWHLQILAGAYIDSKIQSTLASTVKWGNIVTILGYHIFFLWNLWRWPPFFFR